MVNDERDQCTSPTEEANRRRYFRIDDRIGLRLKPINLIEADRLIETLETRSSRAGLVNDLKAIRELHLPDRRALEYKFPTVATYIKVIENQLDALAQALSDSEGFPDTADIEVNLSAQGLSCFWPEALPVNSRAEIKLTLFPERIYVQALVRVLRCDPIDADRYQIALDFVHLRDADREAIIRHVCRLQRQQLQAKAEEAFEERMLQKEQAQKKGGV
ncbi:PilZ domain-containing protein [Caldichromatium japonicum]|uniref:PilZ domain-containing protein n=1 Tax=Caldichromatium japonicum TaxID=2699430 RepID=A0A6G7V9X5_9GAMM|nr:PilZ domain-containing protein [Caldichromatium japonicum]QIK36784.1 PilZ domain-containing protein [Caldichromatium japonicum]